MNDLDNLIDAVEMGVLKPESPHAGFEWKEVFNILHAYNGSLDAAKALHEALLPDDEWEISSYHANPARSWLLGILKAYRSMK